MSRISIKVYSKMGLHKLPLAFLLCWVFCLLSFIALCEDSVVTVKFLKAPRAFSHLNSAAFVFEVLVGGNGACTNSNITCKLDDGVASNCEGRTVLYAGLQDGNHTFEVCTNGPQGVGCGSYNWTVDTVPPTAYITTSTPFTNALNVSINISFSEPCTGPTGGGSFVCSSVNDCNLLVYGSGQVIPSSLNILQPNLQYSVLVGLSSTAQYGQVILVMDKNFCTDSAGNKFTRNQNSTFQVHFDRRSMFVNFTTHVPERLLQLNGETRLVRATNNCIKLRVCLTFPEPVLNSSAEILNSIRVQILYALQLSQGTLLPLAVSKQHPGHRRFEYKAATCISGMAIVTVNINSTIICISRTPVSQVEPITFLYDSLRPAVTLSTPRSESLRPAVMLSTPSHIRTRERNIPMLIKFVKPVFGVNSSIISITGGHIQGFKEISSRIYAVEIKAENDSIYCVSVFIPENVIGDVAGNKNLRSNDLQLCPYHVPKISSVVSVLATASFVATSIAAGLLTVSIASLSSIGTFSTPFSSFSNPARNLFRSACHIQFFALSRWLAVRLPVNYYEFARGLQWSIPYFSLPWETGHIQPVVVGSSPPTNSDSYRYNIHDSGIFMGVQPKQENLSRVASVYKARLRPNPKEYISYFQNNSKPDAEYILDGWEDFSRTMFWLAIIGGSLILLHALLLAILKFRKQKQRGYGLLTFPRFEIFLVNLALPSICEASATLIRGGTPSKFVVGTLLLGTMSFLLLALLWFLSKGITLAKLLQYNEDLQEGRIFNSPGNRGRWTWKIEQNSDCVTIWGPLFEDIRGFMLSQKNYVGSVDTHGDGIITSNEETGELCPKDEEVSRDNVERTPRKRLNSAPQSSVRNTCHSTIPSHIPSNRSDTATTLIDSLTFSTSFHTDDDDGTIAFDDEIEDLCPKADEVSGDNVVRTLDSAPRSSVRSPSNSTKLSHISSKRSNTVATLADSLTSSTSFHTHGDDGIIASDDETEDLCQKVEEVSGDNVVRTSRTRHDLAPRSSVQSMSRSTRPSHIPSKRLDTTATLVDSLTSSIGSHSYGDDGIIASDDETKDLFPKAEEVSGDNVVQTLDSAPPSSVRSTSRSITPSHIPTKRLDTTTTLTDSLTSSTSFHTHGDDGIIASDNETEDLCPKAEEVSRDNVVRTLGTRLDLAPQSLMRSTFGSARPSHIPSKGSDTTTTLIDSLTSSTSFHTYGDDGIIASDNETEDLCPKAEEVSRDNVMRTSRTMLKSTPQSLMQNTSGSTRPSHIPSKRSDIAATLINSLTSSTSFHTHGDVGIIASDDKTKDRCPKAEEVSGNIVVTTLGTRLDSAPRSSVRSTSHSTRPSHFPSKRSYTTTTLVDSLTSSTSFHSHDDDEIIASDDKTEDLWPKAEEVSGDNVVQTLDSALQSSMRSTSNSRPSHIPSKRSETTATLLYSLESSTSFHTHSDDGIIASDNETEDLCSKAEEVSMDNVVRTLETRLDSAPRSLVRSTSRSTRPSHISKRSNTAATLVNSLTSSTSLHTHGNDGIIASNDETEDLCPKAEEVSGDNVLRTLGMRLDLAPQSSVQSTSRSTTPSHIPSKRSDTAATQVDSMTSSTSFHTHGDDGIITSDDKTKDLCPKAEEFSGDNVVITSGTRLDSAPRSSMRSTSCSTRPSHIPSKRSDTIATLVDSLTSSTSFHTHGDDGITASNVETGDLCPKAEEVFGENVVRISGTRLNSAPRSSMRSTSHSTKPSPIPSKRSNIAATMVDSLTSNTSFHTHGDDGIIASDDKTEDLCPKAREVSGENVVRTSETRLDSTPRSSMQSTSRSTRPSHIPSKRSDTVATLVDSLTSSTSFHTHGDDGIIASNVETEDLCPKSKETFGENVLRTLGTRFDLAPQSSMQSLSHSTRPSNLPSKRSGTAATLVDSFTSSPSFLALGDDGLIDFDDKTRDLCPKAEEVSGDYVVRTFRTRLDSTPPILTQSTSHSTQPSHILSTRSRTAATLVDSLTSRTSVHTHGDDGIIAFDGEIEELSRKAEEVSGGSVVRKIGTRLDLAPPSSVQSTSRSTQPSSIPSTRSRTAATLAGSLTSSSSVHPHGDDGIFASDDKIEEVYPKAKDLEVFGGSVHTNSEAPFNQKLFGKLRLYYTLLESLRRIVLGTMTGVYKDHWPSEIPTIILLCITSFQLLFLILNKPFINKAVQLVEIISVSSELCVFAICLVLLVSPSAAQDETIVGVFMLIIFLLGFLPQIMNQWYALQRQIKQLDSKKKCFLTGLKIVSIGLALLFIPQDSLESKFPGIFGDGDQGPKEDNVNIDDQEKEETTATGDQEKEETDDNLDEREEETNRRNSGSSNRRNSGRRNRNKNSGSKNSVPTVLEKSWLNQLRELVKAITNCMGLPKII